MNKETLFYYESVLTSDLEGLVNASHAPDDIPEEDIKRALNVQLESIKSDVVNIQHLMET